MTLELKFIVEEDSSHSFELWQKKEIIASKKMRELAKTSDKRIKVLKFDEQTEIRNVFFFVNPPSQINVIYPELVYKTPFALYGDGSTNALKITPSQSTKTISDGTLGYYIDFCTYALVNDQLHILGGIQDNYKIARLGGCSFTEISARLIENHRYGHASLSIKNGNRAIICFDYYKKTGCEEFDGLNVAKTHETNLGHYYAGLSFYNGLPTVVGGYYADGAVETLTDEGWIFLTPHPRWFKFVPAVGLPSGALWTIGGLDEKTNKRLDELWRLKNDEWVFMGHLSKAVTSASVVLVEDTMFAFPGFMYGFESPIQKIKLDSDENLASTHVFADQGAQDYFPVVFVTSANFCID